jgi:hypothetical protein
MAGVALAAAAVGPARGVSAAVSPAIRAPFLATPEQAAVTPPSLTLAGGAP